MKKKLIFFLAILIITIAGIGYWTVNSRKASANLDSFAKCLSAKGITMYGAYWCPHCQNEKNAFGESFKYVNYVECTEKPNECLAKGVQGYPTWIFPSGKTLVGEQGLEKLSRESSCPL